MSVTLVVGVIGLAAAIVDFKQRRIPNSLPLAIITLTALALWISPAAILSPGWPQSLLGMCVAGAFLLPGWFLGAMGGGDVKLMAAFGFAAGWPLTLLMMLVAFIGVGLWCAAALLVGQRGRQPVAPALAVGFIVVSFWPM